VAKTPGERGRIGTWLREQRLERGWRTADVARAQLERLGGIRLAESVYAEYESGRRIPSEEMLGRLASFYGSRPDEGRDPGDVAAAIDRQTAMLERIAVGLEHQGRALNALVAVLARQGRTHPGAQAIAEEFAAAAGLQLGTLQEQPLPGDPAPAAASR